MTYLNHSSSMNSQNDCMNSLNHCNSQSRHFHDVPLVNVREGSATLIRARVSTKGPSFAPRYAVVIPQNRR